MRDPVDRSDLARARARNSPYQGLRPFTEVDDEWFFGRDGWIDVVIDNIRASRISVLYGESGVGKSSLLSAGVLPRLRGEAVENLRTGGVAELAVVRFDAWSGDDPLAALSRTIRTWLREALPRDLAEGPPADSLADLVARASKTVGGPLVLVLDQFEELFLYHRGDVLDTFEVALTELAWRRDAQVSLTIAIREDALAKLDRFQRRIPRLLDNLVRIRHLEAESAAEAIDRPVEHWNQIHRDSPPYVVEPKLVQKVIEAAQVPVDGAEAAAAEPGIEATVLQLVMQRVWEATENGGDRELTAARLAQLGGTEQIVKTHVRQALSTLTRRERALAAKIVPFLVTASGTKIAQSANQLAEQTYRNPEEIVPVLEKLSRTELYLLRPVASSGGGAAATPYELFHDALAEPIREWRRAYDRDRERRRRLGVVLVALIVIACLLAALLWADRKRSEADHASNAATRASKAATLLALTATANDRAATPLDTALLLSLAAYHTSHSFVARRSVVLSLEDATEEPIELILRTHVRAAALGVSPIGATVATADRSGHVRIWDLRTRRQIGPVLVVADADAHPPGSQPSVALSRDGSIAAGTNARVTLWNAARQIVSLRDHDMHILGDVKTVAFSPDGKLLAAAGYDGYVRLWNLKSHRYLFPARLGRPHGPVNSLAFSLDGKTIASGGDDGAVRSWSVSTRRPRGRPLRSGGGGVLAIAVAPHGRLATANRAGTIHFWDTRNQKQFARPIFTKKAILDLALSADGSRLAAASNDGTVQVWDTRTRRVLLTSSASGSTTSRTVDFDPNGRLVSSSAADGAITIWSARPSSAVGAVLPGRISAQNVLAGSLDGSFLAAGAGKTLRIWNANTGKPLAVEGAGGAGRVRALGFSPDGRLLAEAVGGDVHVWRVNALPRLVPADQVRLGPAATHALAWSRDGLLATADDDGYVRIWDSRTHAKPRLVGFGTDRKNRGPEGRVVYDVAFSPDGRTLASGGWDGTLRLWRVGPAGATTPIGRRDAMKARGSIRNLEFSPNGDMIAVGSGDGTISLWDVATRKEIRETTPGTDAVESVAFASNGEVLVTAGDDGAVRFWDVATLLPLGRPLTGHIGAINSLALSRDASVLASAGHDGTIRLWPGILWRTSANLTGRICGLVAGGLTGAEWGSILRRVSAVAASESRPHLCGA